MILQGKQILDYNKLRTNMDMDMEIDIIRQIKPEIIQFDQKKRELDSYRIINMIDIDKVNKFTKIKYFPFQTETVLYIPECYKNIEMIIELSINYDIEIGSPIPENCKFIIQLDKSSHIYNPIALQRKIFNFLKALPENTKSLKFHSIFVYDDLFQLEVVPYLPRNLKRFDTMTNVNESIDNLPPTLEYLAVLPTNRDYSYAMLPLTLHTLEIKNNDCTNDGTTAPIILPELAHLPVNLKVLSLDSYKYNLASLPEGLEKLIITNYHFSSGHTGEELIMPPNLKILHICKCNDLIINQYPPTLEYLDIDIKVDISMLPATLKGVGLYGFDLAINVIDLPENIVTVYTGDDCIKNLPASVKRVIIIIIHPGFGSGMYAKIGDVTIEMESYNTDRVFLVF